MNETANISCARIARQHNLSCSNAEVVLLAFGEMSLVELNEWTDVAAPSGCPRRRSVENEPTTYVYVDHIITCAFFFICV